MVLKERKRKKREKRGYYYMLTIEKVNSMKGRKVWLTFFCSAALSLLLLYIPFIARGYHLIWAAREGDAATQGVTFLESLRRVGWLNAVGSYDFYLGLGADFLTSMSFYSLFDPFNVFVFILPFDVVWVYDIIMTLKFFAAGAAMLCYLRYRRIAGGYAVALSLMYMFTGTICFTFVRHLNLTSGAVYLPLTVLGLELVYRGKNPFLLVGCSFLCLVNSFYMFFFNSVFLVFYALVYHAEICRKEGGAYFGKPFLRLLKIAGFYLIAVLLASFMLLPNIYGYFHAARSESKGLVSFTSLFGLQALASYFLPIVGEHYSVISFNLFSTILLIAAFLSCKDRAWTYRICTAVFTVGFFVPLFGYMMNIFNYSNNRWSYILSFCMLTMTGLNTQSPESGERYSVPVRRRIAKIVTVAVSACLVFGFSFLAEYLIKGSFAVGAKISLAALSILFAVGVTVFAVLAVSRTGLSVFADREKDGMATAPKILDGNVARRLATPDVLWRLAVVFTVVCCFFYYCVYSSQHNGAALYRSLCSAEERYISSLNETEFFRTDGEGEEKWLDRFRNRGENNAYFGTFSYNSVSNVAVYEFLKENAVYNPTQNLGISGLDNRPALQSLLSVKYFYNPTGVARYGMTKTDEFEALYENKNYVPFGFLYTDTLSEAAYDSLDPLLRQYAMLSAMAVEGTGTTEIATTGALETLSVTGAEQSGFSLGQKQSIRLSVSGCKGKEIYLRLYGASVPDLTTEFLVGGNGKTRSYRYTPKGNLMYSEQRDPCIQLGVAENDELEIELKLIQGREISFDSFAVQAYDISSYEASVAALREAPHLTDVSYDENGIRGEISSETGGWVFLSLPYDKGWRATVDGEDTEIIRANSGFMAVRVESGTRSIELSYSTPLFRQGTRLSLVGVGIFAAATGCRAFFAFRKRKTEK